MARRVTSQPTLALSSSLEERPRRLTNAQRFELLLWGGLRVRVRAVPVPLTGVGAQLVDVLRPARGPLALQHFSASRLWAALLRQQLLSCGTAGFPAGSARLLRGNLDRRLQTLYGDTPRQRPRVFHDAGACASPASLRTSACVTVANDMPVSPRTPVGRRTLRCSSCTSCWLPAGQYTESRVVRPGSRRFETGRRRRETRQPLSLSQSFPHTKRISRCGAGGAASSSF